MFCFAGGFGGIHTSFLGFKVRITWWTFCIFFLFFCSGGGRGSLRRREGGRGRFFLDNPRRGGLQEGEGPKGREGVCGELGNLRGGGG